MRIISFMLKLRNILRNISSVYKDQKNKAKKMLNVKILLIIRDKDAAMCREFNNISVSWSITKKLD